jgi:hypothetical protein
MAENRPQHQKPVFNQEHMKKKVEVSNFDPNAILRGAQLTDVGGKSPGSYTRCLLLLIIIEALRALQNPRLFTSKHYKQAAIAVAAGIAIRVIVEIPACAQNCTI